MIKQDVVDHFGNIVLIANALGMTKQAVSKWGKTIPMRRAFELERITGGALKAGFTPVQTLPIDLKEAL